MERSDEDLVIALAAGDADAFSAFYRRHLAAVTAYFSRRVADREAIFDLTAEVFAGVAVAAGRFDPARGAAIAWLFGIAAHKLADARRRERVEAVARGRLALEPIAITDEDLARIDAMADAPDLAELVAALPEAQRRAVQARIVEDLEYRAIAAELECSEAVVRQRVHRGLKALRERLEARA